jgi:hypothetical protein
MWGGDVSERVSIHTHTHTHTHTHIIFESEWTNEMTLYLGGMMDFRCKALLHKQREREYSLAK